MNSVRLGVGGGGRVLRGGVSAGRGGVRGGVGVGPFHLSGGSRGSRSRMSDEDAEAFGTFFLTLFAVGMVLVAVFLFVAGPLLYLTFILALIAAFAAVRAYWQYFYNGHQTRISEVIFHVLGHATAVSFTHFQRWMSDDQVRRINSKLTKGDSDPFFVFPFADLRYWSWWSNQSNALIHILWWLDVYLLVPSFAISTGYLIIRRFRSRDIPPCPEKLSAIQSRMYKFKTIVEQQRVQVDFANIPKKERHQIKKWMKSSAAELQQFWRSQLDLHPTAFVTSRQTKRYSRRFESDIRNFLELERQDGFILEREMFNKKKQNISGLSTHRVSEISLLLEKLRSVN